MEPGEGISLPATAIVKPSKVSEQLKSIGDRLKFSAELTTERLHRPDWAREERENKARRGLMTNILLDRENPPLQPEEIRLHTRNEISKVEMVLRGRESVSFGSMNGNALVFQKNEQGKYVAAHFIDGKLRTLAAIDTSLDAAHPARVLLNDTHEGRIESSEEVEHSLTRTAVHTFDFLVNRGTKRFLPELSTIRTVGNQTPAEFTEQINAEITPPAKLVLGEKLFNEINEREGKPLENGGVFIVADTAFGNPLASPFDKWRLTQGVALSRYSEIDDFMNILACRGDKQLSEKVKAFGHTSRGSSFTTATQFAATVGTVESKPVFPGYNPYLQHNESTDPIRLSPAAFAILELGKARMNGKEAVLVDEAPTTERLYATVEQLAKERGVDISKLPIIFMVAANINEQTGQAELLNNVLNFNYTMGIDHDQSSQGIYNSDTKRGFEKALEMFDDITLFTPEVGVTAIPLSDFDKFSNFIGRSGNKDYEKIAEIFKLRAKEFASGRRSLEITGSKLLGRPMNIEPNSFPAQDTLIGAYLIHPEWFTIRELPLKYTTLAGESKTKDHVRVVTGLTETGKGEFRGWLWKSIETNFEEPNQL